MAETRMTILPKLLHCATVNGEPVPLHSAESCPDPWECQEKGWSRG